MTRALALVLVLLATPAHALHYKLCTAGTRATDDCTTDDTNATTGCPGATCPGCCVSPGSNQCTWAMLVGTTTTGPGVTCCTVLQGNQTKTDPQIRALIPAKTAAELGAQRKRMIQYIWKQETLPTTTPTITTGVADPFDWTPPPSVASIDKWTTTMPSGFVSEMFLFKPAQMRMTRLFILHQGHTGSMLFGNVDAVATELLNRSYAVLVINMPGYGTNTAPVSMTTSAQHDAIAPYESPTQSTTYFFIHPTLEAVNYALNVVGFKTVYMLGLSGGGWATTMYAAVDPRVHRSYEQSGSAPHWWWLSPCYSGSIEHEQGNSGLFASNGGPLGDPLQEYPLGAFESSYRRRMQITNQWDNCCFFGVSLQQYDPVVDDIITTVGAGARYDYIMDSSNDKHEYPLAQFPTWLAWFGE